MKRLSLFFPLLILGLFAVDAPTQAQLSGSDLVVTTLTTDPTQPAPDERIELVAMISNTGRADVVQGFNVRFKMDGFLLTDKRLNFGLGAGEEEQLTFTWRAEEGEHVFEVEVDIFKNVSESNEFNNVSEHAFTVRRPGAIRSVSRDLVESIGLSLSESGELLQIEFTPDLFALANQFRQAFLSASNKFAAGRANIENLVEPMPSVLQSDPQIQAALRIAQIYESIASDFKLAADGIQAADIDQVPAAFQGIRSSMSILSDVELGAISYAGLRDVIELLDRGLELADELALAFTGAQVNTTQVTSDLVDVLHEIGEIWIEVHEETLSTAEALVPTHLNGNGEPVQVLTINDAISISVANANQLDLIIYDAAGRLVFETSAEAGQVTWNGKDSEGNTISPGTYYYRLEITSADGTTRTELVIIIFS